ncbi:glycosyltransferase family 4 protein [Mycobacterium sp. 2YAF39]|uniref:glycosyltransferase family 4 protein n=1 Tax=Mycobacterium sp. 2YAF39 TaxID=3233033 RepID=UPI003F95668D
MGGGDSESDVEGDAAPLRFAFLTELYYPNIGGQEVFFGELGAAMVRRGHSVDVYCIAHQPGLVAEEVINGVRVHRSRGSGGYKKPLIPALRRNWSDILRFSAWVRKLAKTQEYDFYLMNQWPLLHIPALTMRARRRGGIHWCEVRRGRPLRLAQAFLPRLVASNFAVSDAVADAMRIESGREFSVLPSGIDVARYQPSERANRSGALYVGRLSQHKNLPLLIDGFALAAERGFAGDLVIAGDGDARVEVEEYAMRSTVADRIKFLGFVTEELKIELLSRAAILGMPSTREGFPRVITEAMASGLPVVTPTFAENGAKDVVLQYGVGVVCGTEPTEFAEAMLAADAGWEAFSRAGLTAAQTLDWGDIARSLEEHAHEVLAKQ